MCRQDVVDDLLQRHDRIVPDHPARFDPGEVEDVIDQACQPLTFRVDDAEEFLLRVQILLIIVQQNLGEGPYRGQGRTQFVGDGGEKGVFHPVQLREFLVRLLEVRRPLRHPAIQFFVELSEPLLDLDTFGDFPFKLLVRLFQFVCPFFHEFFEALVVPLQLLFGLFALRDIPQDPLNRIGLPSSIDQRRLRFHPHEGAILPPQPPTGKAILSSRSDNLAGVLYSLGQLLFAEDRGEVEGWKVFPRIAEQVQGGLVRIQEVPFEVVYIYADKAAIEQCAVPLLGFLYLLPLLLDDLLGTGDVLEIPAGENESEGLAFPVPDGGHVAGSGHRFSFSVQQGNDAGFYGPLGTAEGPNQAPRDLRVRGIHEAGEVLLEQIFLRVPKKLLCLRVHHTDKPVSVQDDDGIGDRGQDIPGKGFRRRVEELVPINRPEHHGHEEYDRGKTDRVDRNAKTGDKVRGSQISDGKGCNQGLYLLLLETGLYRAEPSEKGLENDHHQKSEKTEEGRAPGTVSRVEAPGIFPHARYGRVPQNPFQAEEEGHGICRQDSCSIPGELLRNRRGEEEDPGTDENDTEIREPVPPFRQGRIPAAEHETDAQLPDQGMEAHEDEGLVRSCSGIQGQTPGGQQDEVQHRQETAQGNRIQVVLGQIQPNTSPDRGPS